MARIRYEVVNAASQRDESPAERLAAHITEGGTKGWELVQIIPLFDVIQVVWKIPREEQRG